MSRTPIRRPTARSTPRRSSAGRGARARTARRAKPLPPSRKLIYLSLAVFCLVVTGCMLWRAPELGLGVVSKKVVHTLPGRETGDA